MSKKKKVACDICCSSEKGSPRLELKPNTGREAWTSSPQAPRLRDLWLQAFSQNRACGLRHAHHCSVVPPAYRPLSECNLRGQPLCGLIGGVRGAWEAVEQPEESWIFQAIVSGTCSGGWPRRRYQIAGGGTRQSLKATRVIPSKSASLLGVKLGPSLEPPLFPPPSLCSCSRVCLEPLRGWYVVGLISQGSTLPGTQQHTVP